MSALLDTLTAKNTINKASASGFLGADPRLSKTADGRDVVNMSVGVSDNWLDKKTGEKREKTEWIRITAFGDLAVKMANSLKKGDAVTVDGKLHTSQFLKDGNTVYATSLIADEIGFFSDKSKMFSHQSATVKGMVTAEPIINGHVKGSQVANLLVATVTEWKNAQGETSQYTEYHKVTLFGDNAEYAVNNIKKGDMVQVTGRMQTTAYQKDGVDQYKTVIIANKGKVTVISTEQAEPVATAQAEQSEPPKATKKRTKKATENTAETVA